MKPNLFGFSTMKINEIELTRSNADGKSGNENADLDLCISCGSCTATCTMNFNTHSNFRKAVLFQKRGLFAEAKNAINECCYCGKCTFLCPRGLAIRQVIKLILQTP